MKTVNNNIFYQNTYQNLSTPKKILTKIVAIFAAIFTLGLAYKPTFRWMVTHLSNDSTPTTQNISSVAITVLSTPSENNSNTNPTEIESYIPELARALRVSEATLNSTSLNLVSKELASVPDTLGNLSQLQRLWLSHNQLTIIPDTLGNLSQLRELWLSYNQLTIIPDTLGNLSQLKTLLLYGNRLTTVPECLFRLPNTCSISIFDNPIPIAELRALQARVNTPGYSGPRFHISIYEERVQESTQTATEELIRRWGGDSNKLSHHEQIKTWLQRLARTSDYERNPNKVKEEIKSILLWMGQLSEGDTKAQAYLIIEEAVATCGDRVALARNDLSCLKKISESGDLSLDQLKNLLVGLHRLELVKKAAELKLSSMNGRDDIETHLHLMTALKEPLNLPIETNSLLYQGMSGFSEAEIEQIKINILNYTSSPEQVISILIASPLWQKKLDALPEMAPLHTKIAQEKANFQVAVEGEEVEYHAEFLRLEKEDWNVYLILTRNFITVF